MTTSKTNRIGEKIEAKFGKPKPVLTERIYKEVLRIPKKTFRKYVDNKIQPRIDELQRIADWLNVSPKDLY